MVKAPRKLNIDKYCKREQQGSILHCRVVEEWKERCGRDEVESSYNIEKWSVAVYKL